jgi:hypothetical protein
MTNETLGFWNAATAACSASDIPAAHDAIENLTGIALHGTPHIARRALDTLRGVVTGAAPGLAEHAGEAAVWC